MESNLESSIINSYMRNFKQYISSPRIYLLIFVGIFFYSLAIGLIIQKVLVPRLFPSANDGLVILDSIGFDLIAKEKASQILIHGWSSWELNPSKQLPAGIASIFYVIFGKNPSSFLPFNAIMHSLSACLVFGILRKNFSQIPSLLGVFFFAVYPTSLEWVSQIHRDGIFIFGNLLVLTGLILVVNQVSKNKLYVPASIFSTIAMILGYSLVYLVRPYWIDMVFVFLCVVFAMLLFGYLNNFFVSGSRRLVFFQLTPLFLFFLFINLSGLSNVNNLFLNQSQNVNNQSATSEWVDSKWIPSVIDNKFKKLVILRRGVIFTGGNSLLKDEPVLNSTFAVIKYVPRAISIGLLSPFPNLWSGKGSTPAMTLARKGMGVLTLVNYLCLIGVFFAMRERFKNPTTWLILTFSLSGILAYSLVYPNIGSLIRFRFLFYMMLTSYGFSFWIDTLIKNYNSGSRL